MEHYVTLGGVRSWYAEHGAGDPLVLLHPGLVDARAFGPNLAAWLEKVAATQLIEPTLTSEDLGKITCRTLVMLGDDEVRLEHAVAMDRILPKGELAIIPTVAPSAAATAGNPG